MRSSILYTCLLLAGFVVGISLWRATPIRSASRGTPEASSGHWNVEAAADYLDSRETWWQGWQPAQQSHGTICVSCHTVVPYAMVRPALRQELGETGMGAPELIMIDNVEKRVNHWSEMAPYYSETAGPGKTAEAHATEAVLNAVILASYDTWQGHLRPVTRTALDEAWALQETTGEDAGAWKWLNFHLGPWEAEEGVYQGAALMMLEVGDAPDGYANEPGVREYSDRLQKYLRRQYSAQPLMNQLYILWASAKVPGLLTEAQRKTLIASLQGLQRADGGWRLSSMDKRERHDDSPEPTESDGVATGLAVLAMEESGTSRQDTTLERGLEWLEEHQGKDGDWHALSLNEERDPKSDIGLFMNDAATGYAVLALEEAH
jgi:squalene-hopene/tetraprenyl-beta-curcumene cyclase